MAIEETAPMIDWGKYAPTRPLLWRAIGGWAGIAILTILIGYAAALAGQGSTVIGGDFIAFHGAATAAISGDAATIYDPVLFNALLRENLLFTKEGSLNWQYPPTYLLLIAPFAFMPYLVAAPLWSGLTAFGFFAALRLLTRDRLFLFAVMASPAAYVAFITGQNGFFTAGLFIIAALLPHKRPILAGIAAGLLTVKPHLAVLIPIAYLAAGCWRALFVSAATSFILALLSIAAFGFEPWLAFFNAASDAMGHINDGVMPLAKMTTPYSAVLFAGAPTIIAKAALALCAAFALFFLWRLWRRSDDPLLRAAGLAACAMLAIPYGYYYEFLILSISGVFVVMRGLEHGWLSRERSILAAIYIGPIVMSAILDWRLGVSLGFLTTYFMSVLVVRRASLETPGLFSFK